MISIAAAPVRADDAPLPAVDPQEHPSVDQVIYRGVVGNILEAVPLPAEQRVQLQRGNAVIGNTLTGRSLTVLLGLASPVLMIGGLIWGIWSAVNIKATASAHAAAALPSPLPPARPPTPIVEAGEVAPGDATDVPTDPALLARTQ
jgi:hypothetical protein